jgi:hypothetical protein
MIMARASEIFLGMNGFKLLLGYLISSISGLVS